MIISLFSKISTSNHNPTHSVTFRKFVQIEPKVERIKRFSHDHPNLEYKQNILCAEYMIKWCKFFNYKIKFSGCAIVAFAIERVSFPKNLNGPEFVSPSLNTYSAANLS